MPRSWVRVPPPASDARTVPQRVSSPYADDLVANVGDYTSPRSFTLAAAPVAKRTTSVTVRVTKTARQVKVNGSVSPYSTGQVTVQLFRKKSGIFRLVATKRPSLGSFSVYKTAFARPKPGACKVVSRYGGDATHMGSTRSVKFRC